MRSLVTTIVMACTAFMFVPGAQADNYSSAVTGCKSAIYDRVSGDKVFASLRDAKKKGNSKVQLDFNVKVTANSERTQMKARCLATLGGEVLDLALS